MLLDAPGLRRFVNGNCLWIAFVSGKDRILQPVVNQFAIDKYVLRTDIYKPAEFDLFCLYDRFEPEIVSSQSNMNDSKWECDKNLRALGVDPLTNKEEGICFAKIPNYSSFNVRIALTIFEQVKRLFLLQNEQTYSSLSQLTLMATHLFKSRDGSSQVMNLFVNEECKEGDNRIAVILQRSSKPLGFRQATNSELNPMILLELWPAE